MDSNLQTSPNSSDAKTAFRKPSTDSSNRQYRRRSPVSGLSSSEGSSPQRDRSISPIVSRDDLEKSADTRPGRDGRELDRDSRGNRYSRNGDSYRYSDRQSSRSSHGYSRHDKRADEDSKYDRFSSRSDRESRISNHSDHPRLASDLSRSKDYSQNAEKYSRDRYDGSGHRSRDKGKESPFLERYKDKDLSFDRVGSGRRHGKSLSEEMDRDRRRWDRDGRDEKVDYHRSWRDKKADHTSYEESRGHWNDSSSVRERDNDKRPSKDGYRSGHEDMDLSSTFRPRNYSKAETMRGTSVLSWILIICLSQVAVRSQYYSDTLPYHPRPPKVTNLHFFMHEHTGVTAVVLTQANITSNNSSMPFATLVAVNDPLRTGPEPDSEVIGNVQGISLLAGSNASSTQYIEFGFNTGKFNGSSLSVFSRGEPGLAVVGGRGRFMMAKGTALFNPILINATNVIMEFNFTVVHY